MLWHMSLIIGSIIAIEHDFEKECELTLRSLLWNNLQFAMQEVKHILVMDIRQHYCLCYTSM